MEKEGCEKLLKEMRECIKEKKGTLPCRKLVDKFGELCKKEDKKEEVLKQFLE